MENNEIMVNEEIMDATEEVTVKTGNGLKVAAGIGLAALVGYGIYKLGKRIYTAAKAKKEQQDLVDADILDDECVESID